MQRNYLFSVILLFFLIPNLSHSKRDYVYEQKGYRPYICPPYINAKTHFEIRYRGKEGQSLDKYYESLYGYPNEHLRPKWKIRKPIPTAHGKLEYVTYEKKPRKWPYAKNGLGRDYACRYTVGTMTAVANYAYCKFSKGEVIDGHLGREWQCTPKNYGECNLNCRERPWK